VFLKPEINLNRFEAYHRFGGWQRRQRMIFEEMSDEWKEWIELTPIERFRQSEKIFAQYLAMGGSLDPDPDPTSPFYDPETSSSGAAYGRPGLRVLRRGAV